MPDGMTPEKSSIDSFRSLGQPAQLPGADETAKAAQEFPRPEYKSGLPDIRMQLDEDDKKEENKDKDEQEYRKRHQYREGQTQLEIISTSTEKHQLIDAERTFMNGFEDMSLHPDGSVSEYRVEDAIAVVGNRKADMSYSRQDLIDLGYLIEVQNQQTGQKEDRLVFPGFGYTSRIETVEQRKKILTPDGNVHHIEVEESPIQVFIPGTNEQRIELRGNLHQVQSEMTTREDLVKKLRWVWNQTENLEGLVQFYFMGTSTAEAMRDLCDAEGRTIANSEKNGERIAALTKTEGGVEYRKGHELGDATSVAIQCFEIAALSEKPAEFEALLKKPGIKFLFDVSDQQIDDLFLKLQDRAGRELNPNLVKWVGEPWQWDKKVNGPKKNVKNEVSTRGLLTRRGNILVESNWNDLEDVSEQIERFIGGGNDEKVIRKNTLAQKDARDARFLAWAEFRVTGEASDLGGQVYHYGEDKYIGRREGNYVAHEMGGMTSCDRVKVIAPNVFRGVYKHLKPEIRSAGPNGSLDKYPDRFTVPYFKTWTGSTDYGKRTFQEIRWGYRAGKEIDILSDKVIDLQEEKAFRLGELPWKSLGPKAYNGAALGPFIAGREKIGIFTLAMRTDYRPDELKDQAFFEKLGQYMGISFNLQTVRDGKLRGIYNGDLVHDGQVTEKVKDEIRNYKKQFLVAFWDGIRSLPQYREWRAMYGDKMDSASSPLQAWPIDRIKYRLGRIGILTPEEAVRLPSEPLGSKDKNY